LTDLFSDGVTDLPIIPLDKPIPTYTIIHIPSKTIQVIITCPLVGGSEFMTRVVGQKLEELWIRPVVIEVEKIKHA
jgi:hypothetical protein